MNTIVTEYKHDNNILFTGLLHTAENQKAENHKAEN